MRGIPNTFRCPVGVAERKSVYDNVSSVKHPVSRTGKTKKSTAPSSKRYGGDGLSHEWVCGCGATGWSSHPDMKRHPIKKES